MKATKFIITMSLLAAATYAGICARSPPQSETRQSVVERSKTQADVAVRLYYNPMINQPDLSPGPLILLPVSSQDPRLDTRPAWILYVTHMELRSVLGVLAQSNLEWKESSVSTRLVVDPFDLPGGHHDSMQVAVGYPTGSATAEVEAKQVCGLLSNVSESLSSPKAREAVSFYARTVSCPSATRGGLHGDKSR
jgi:hypothetical protein